MFSFFFYVFRCLQNGHCEKPTCQYGEYDAKVGHCPRQEEGQMYSLNRRNLK